MSVNVSSAFWRIKTTNGNIPLKVVDRSGVFGEEQSSATETYIIRATDLRALVLVLFPLPIIQGGTVVYPRRAEMPGVPALTAKSIAWKGHVEGLPSDPFGSDPLAPADTYQNDLEVTVTYSTSAANDAEANPADPKTWLEITANGAGNFLAAGTDGSATWGGGTDPVIERGIPSTITEPLVEWSVRWSQIPYEFWNTTLLNRLRDALGKVNGSAMSLFHDAPADTILLTAWTMKQQFTWRDGLTGQAPIQLEMRFLEKNFVHTSGQVTHQHFWRPGKGFQTLEFDGVQPAFAQDDLDKIFTG